jgi:hypothetical protein
MRTPPSRVVMLDNPAEVLLESWRGEAITNAPACVVMVTPLGDYRAASLRTVGGSNTKRGNLQPALDRGA